MADKKGPKEAVDTSAMYIELSKLEKTGDFDKALKVCNKILNVDPKDDTAFHCKMVCLMQTGKFSEAYKQMVDTHFTNIELTFEKAYCLYRDNQPEEALKVLEASKHKSDRIKELRAQILYRLEQYEECYGLYREIIKQTSDDFEQERLTNLQAAAVYVKDAPIAEEDDTYEMCYNRGCQLLAHGRYVEAEEELKKAEKMCKEMMTEEEADEEEIERETGIIRVQAGFAIQMQGEGRDREAQAIYNSVLKSKPADIGLVAVTSNNLVTINKDQNIFDSKKKIKAATVEGLEHKLTTSHRAAIARNNALLAMYTNQVDLCKTLVQEVASNFGQFYDDEDRELIMAAVLARSGKVQESVDLLTSKKRGQDLERVLIAAQVLLEKGDVPATIAILEKLSSSVRHRTGILSALVSLYLANDDRGKAAKLLKEAVLEKSNNASKEDMNIVWRKTAEFHLKGDEPSVAAKSLEELLKANPKDKTTLAQLVLAYAKFDLKKAMEVSKKLPDFAAKAVDVDALEATATMSKYGKKGTGIGKPASPKPQTPEQIQEDLSQKKKKKKRKRKLPKNYNPNVDPDPERWIPRKERTGYRRTRKERRKGEKFTGAQGNAVGQSEAFDYSKKSAAGLGAIPKSPQVQEAPPGPRQQQRKPHNKAKKKSGKKHF